MDNLQWFKFSPSHWFMGRIQRCSEVAQARFMRIVCIYWNNECQMSVDDAKIELDDEFDKLVKLKIIEVDGNSISIKFLDAQYDECLAIGNKRSKAAKARWNKAKGKQKESNSMQLHNVAMQYNADKIREDKIREEESRKEIPSLEDFIAHAVSRKLNVKRSDVKQKYYEWVDNGWRTLGDKQRDIVNWKSTLTNSIKYMGVEESRRIPL